VGLLDKPAMRACGRAAAAGEIFLDGMSTDSSP
jgi:hypothetical protein